MSNFEVVEHNLAPEVPAHWQVVPLGDVLINIVGGGTPSKTNAAYWDGDIPWLTVKDMRSRRPADAIDHISVAAIKESSTNLIPADTVIIATRIGLGKVVRVPFEAAINQDLKALVAIPEVGKGYLEYWIVSIASYLESIGSGTTVKGIRLEQVRSLPFPFAPVNEQTRIVAEIEKQFSRLDEAVANLKRVKANLKRYKAAVLKAAVEGKLTEEWRKQHPDVEPADKLLERILAERRKAAGKGKYKEPVGPDTSRLPELPELPAGWVWASLQTLVHQLGDGLHGTPSYTNGTTCYFVNGNNLQNGKIEIKPGTKTVSFEEMRKYIKILTPQTVLVSINGTLGNVAFYNGEEVILGKSACYFNLSSLVSKHYIRILIESPYFYTYSNVNATGSTIKNLSLKAMNELPVSLPPLAEQHQIVAEVERRLSIVAGAEAQVDANLRRADRLRQSILKQAFSGQLVPQDPNDEPASVLLERMRATQPAQSKEPAARQQKRRTPAPKTGAPAPKALLQVSESTATYGDAIASRILAAMQPALEYARADLADPLGLTTGQWNAAIQELKRVGKVRQVGEKRGARYLLK